MLIGVVSAGLTITVFPAASAGASLSIAEPKGWFHRVIRAQTPTGSRTTVDMWPVTY